MLQKLIFSFFLLFSFIAVPVQAEVDYDLWTKILTEYVDEEGRVDYKGLKKNKDDLNTLIKQFEEFDVNTLSSEAETLAFWINAYNAITLHVVREAYPAKSIRFINFGLVWKLPRKVAQTKHSLGHIEHEIIRPMGDPRIHFALNCASIGCPELPQEAFLPEKLEEQLAHETREFFKDEKNIKLDRNAKILYYTELLDWFEEDFLWEAETLSEYITAQLPEEIREFVTTNQVEFKSMKYDWDLNAQAKK